MGIQALHDALLDKLEAYDSQRFEIVIRMGSPAGEIANYAKEIDADLIVMPSLGKTGLKHFALGSVAERVVRIAPCPVLILKKELQSQEGKRIIPYG